MKTIEFEKLIKTIENMKNKKAKAEGVIEEIEKEWDKEYGFCDMDSIDEKEKELMNKKEKYEKRENSILKMIEELIDWEELE